ncbi:hypothetical protein NBRC110019_02440 [Neptunitalea chrysea]|uniref:5'-Nucleotidase C-terminal domain-containing protein n=1 Tax=Neptunitalea chrysea TaxID=1647581 RepID=A0A9W6B2Y8_9FLAO|nr:5'-nucleotidase [Neptunitalea chrysea]GLB51205.1 hypothetical protein NBRC110019_02440 [Neptunitalea chrysea]
MEIKHFVIIITLFLSFSCSKEPQKLREIKASQININDSLSQVTEIENFIKPKRDYIKSDLNKVLCYNPEYLSKKAINLNTALGNLMADIVYEQVNPIFHERTQKDIDFVLLNYGGIRATIPEGNVTTRTAYEVMPFENSIEVVELPYEAILKIADYLIKNKKAHPVSKQFHLEISPTDAIRNYTIKGEIPNKNQTYNVATSDYLLSGGDNMEFFKDSIQTTSLDYLIRKAMIDYFAKQDTLKTATDKRLYLYK